MYGFCLKLLGMIKLPAALAVLSMVLTFASAYASNINPTTTLNDELRPEPSESDLAAPRFATAIDDLPLMPGLNLIENNDVVFNSASAGRLVETDAVGAVDIDDVYNFYQRTLPQLGWTFMSMRAYSRNKEILHIDAHADGKNTTVHFALMPVAQK